MKQKVTLQRKLPALVHLAGTTLKVKVTAHEEEGDLPHDFEALLGTELMKNDPHLTLDDTHPSTIITCQIVSFSHPPPTVTVRPVVTAGKSTFSRSKGPETKNQTFTRITGALSVSFQARTASGQTLISDNVNAKYDQEFDSSGNSTTHGMLSSVTGTFNRMRGGESQDLNPPTDAELRSHLILDAVQQIAEHIVNTNETLEVYLAREKGALDDGDKQAEAGLWQRALETFETATPFPRQEDDAYRLYNIGVSYEALAYQAEDAQAAMKFLDQAAIYYGKTIDAKPSEKYFLEPQKRIETAIAHYKQLEEQKHPKPASSAAASGKAAGSTAAASKSAAPKPLTNAQVVAMVKSGLDDDTIIQTIRAAKATDFDLSAAGKQSLANGGVSAQVLAAMQARAPKKPAPGT